VVYLVIGGMVVASVVLVRVLWLVAAQPAHRRLVIKRTFGLAVAAFLIVDGVISHRQTWLNVGAGVFMLGFVAFDWARSRRRLPPGVVR
jgi:hypothetical protein